MRSIALTALILAPAAILGAGCACKCPEPRPAHHHHAHHGKAGKEHKAHKARKPRVKLALAYVQPTAGNTAKGVVRFEKVRGGVKVTADIEGLAPGTKHGFHIHEYGDCSKPDGSSAGGHYNPEGHAHAGPDAAMRHAGDLGNLTADASGKAHLELTLANVSVAGRKNPVLGRGVIVHKDTDDLKSQPTGAAGARIGCGVIGVVPAP